MGLSKMERERNLWGEILEFNDEHFPNWRETHPIFYSNALAGETGEICNLTKKLGGGGTNRYTPDIRELAFELVDIHFYLTLLAESLKIDRELFERYFHEKMEVLRERMKDEVVWRERKALKGFNIPLKTPIDASNPHKKDSIPRQKHSIPPQKNSIIPHSTLKPPQREVNE